MMKCTYPAQQKHEHTHATVPGMEAGSWECHACTLDGLSNKDEDGARANTLISCGMPHVNTRAAPKTEQFQVVGHANVISKVTATWQRGSRGHKLGASLPPPS